MGRNERCREAFREVDYHKDFESENIPDEETDADAEGLRKTRISEVTRTIREIDLLEGDTHRLEPAPARGKLRRSLAVAAAACLAAAAVLAIGLSVRARQELALERALLRERAGSHTLCNEEMTRLRTLLEAAERARFEAEQRAESEAEQARRLGAELARSREDARMAWAAVMAAMPPATAPAQETTAAQTETTSQPEETSRRRIFFLP